MTFFHGNDGRGRATAVARTQKLDDRGLWWHTAFLGAAVIALCVAAGSTALAGPGDEASAAMIDAKGNEVGTVELTQMQNGTLVVAKLMGLPEGTHAFHVHETGECEPPFSSAGGHFNPTAAQHGFDSQTGPHVGDMPNIHVPASGELTVEIFNSRLEVGDSLLDNDGAAIVIHEGADDYETDPAGDAGARIACGVIKGPN